MMKIKIKVRRSGYDEDQLSAQTVASIDDLLTEILLRLPMRSLIRFKVVSKHWHSLITNPSFCLLRNPHRNPAVGLFLHDSSSPVQLNPRFEYIPFTANNSSNPPFRKLNFTKNPSRIRILQSCNGLLLCSSFYARGYNPRYYIYNPTTKRFSKLPKPAEATSRSSTGIHGMSLAFDPTKSPYYRVVCVSGMESDSREYQYQFEIYSSQTGPWRKCGEPFTAHSPTFTEGVYWNGAIHWISNKGGDSLYFNVDEDDNDMPKILPLPPIPDGWEWRSNYYFGESCDHLHYIELLGVRSQFKVYEMKRDYSEWLVKYQVDLSHVVASYPMMNRDNYDPMNWYSYGFSILTLVRGENEEDSFLVIQIPGKVIRYNLVYGSFEAMNEFEGAEHQVNEGSLRYPSSNGLFNEGSLRNGFQYIESLCCV